MGAGRVVAVVVVLSLMGVYAWAQEGPTAEVDDEEEDNPFDILRRRAGPHLNIPRPVLRRLNPRLRAALKMKPLRNVAKELVGKPDTYDLTNKVLIVEAEKRYLAAGGKPEPSTEPYPGDLPHKSLHELKHLAERGKLPFSDAKVLSQISGVGINELRAAGAIDPQTDPTLQPSTRPAHPHKPKKVVSGDGTENIPEMDEEDEEEEECACCVPE